MLVALASVGAVEVSEELKEQIRAAEAARGRQQMRRMRANGHQRNGMPTAEELRAAGFEPMTAGELDELDIE